MVGAEPTSSIDAITCKEAVIGQVPEFVVLQEEDE
jgi:hypothetical protein